MANWSVWPRTRLSATSKSSEKQSITCRPKSRAHIRRIAWPQIRGFRNILVHQYFGVDIEIVRDVVKTHRLQRRSGPIESRHESRAGRRSGREPPDHHGLGGDRRLIDPAVRSYPGVMGVLFTPSFHEIGQPGEHWTGQGILNVVAAAAGEGSQIVLDQHQAGQIAPDLVLLACRLEFEGCVSR